MKRKNISFIKEDECTGCYACYSKCHRNAITMVQNEEGFYYPSVDPGRCTSCGLCVSACASLGKRKNSKRIDLFRANAKDLQVRERGSSGGIVELLSNEIINSDGVVYGAAFLPIKKEIVHMSTDAVSLEKLLKSKYVQSQINDSFTEIETILKNAGTVLFSGTPCQVAGLKAFLGKEYNNLFTVDFICHGVPSPGLFSKVIEDLEEKHSQKIKDISFRSKVRGWRRSTTTTIYENGEVENIPNRESMFFLLFLNDYSLRKSCYTCEYYCKHASDITVADDWTVPAKIDDDTGMSLVFVNNDQGRNLFARIAPQLNCFELDIGSFDMGAYKHVYSRKGRKEFFRDYRRLTYTDLQKKWKSKATEKQKSVRATVHYYCGRIRRLFKDGAR